MAGIIGPNSYLPGQEYSNNDKFMCDEHPDKKSTHRIISETDSFGSEIVDMCDECLAKYKESKKNDDTSGECDWCKEYADKLIKHRNFEEGTTGIIYDVCGKCLEVESISLQNELNDSNEYYDECIEDILSDDDFQH